VPSHSNYVCVPCQVEMRPKRNGVIVEEHREEGKPYKIWEADLWECPKCHHECILGFADRPICYYNELEYEENQKKVEFHIF